MNSFHTCAFWSERFFKAGSSSSLAARSMGLPIALASLASSPRACKVTDNPNDSFAWEMCTIQRVQGPYPLTTGLAP